MDAIRQAIDRLIQRSNDTDRRIFDIIASVPFSGRRAPANNDRAGNGIYLVQNYGVGALAIAHNLGRTPAIWFACGAAVGSQVPKITVTAVSSTSITIQTDLPSNGVIVFIE